MTGIKNQKREEVMRELIKDLEDKRDKGWYGEVIISFKGGAVEKAGFTENKKYL
ncbi:hypothetical protein [Ilyobacter polytropus]|uniref:Uncharacterized protein n=1 Tax=Ilyobacter polytropus (strain ATCC 51220 / DSM 2926 / LMG 16218 / CuHBu1) TaxID=572544 RepID=E3H7D4_ILYPC|nr:hypothetical protein [Ilyobacter polytropus]ADO82830.1 hypothetical protein Ilyop_1049 [Ilyobacter polytropus DSM 2926]